ncbi:MAG TPA: hypothetical protein VH257_16730, partial [Chloroflexota bacterium]|nr:hypothetical protein [Chloroflexota bacterium]
MGRAVHQGGAPYFGEIGRLAERMAPSLGRSWCAPTPSSTTTARCAMCATCWPYWPQVLVLHPVPTIRSDALFREAAAAGVPSIRTIDAPALRHGDRVPVGGRHG